MAGNQATLPRLIPKQFQTFFWDVDAGKLDPSQHPLYVINRLLDKGNLTAARWVRRNFPENLIIETIKTRRDFSQKTVNFWSEYYHIPKEEIKCMQEPYRSLRKQLWPY